MLIEISVQKGKLLEPAKSQNEVKAEVSQLPNSVLDQTKNFRYTISWFLWNGPGPEWGINKFKIYLISDLLAILENYKLDVFWPADVLPYIATAFTCKRKESAEYKSCYDTLPLIDKVQTITYRLEWPKQQITAWLALGIVTKTLGFGRSRCKKAKIK